ncbi:E3 ubiquitin-protein ligase SIAH1A-like [Centruroides vittatus]|uniref:E3 ubiquitin-protein ligase SIAH1A-like n=1 Tax=Centruroides vittatus TaxID=120091 RepID=UPI0035100D41
MEESTATTPTETANARRGPAQRLLSDPALVALFECPVCYEHMSPPRYQCPAGHMICSRCKELVQWCPTCRREMDNHRNISLEKLAEIVTLSCKYRDNGCKKSYILREREAHERGCSFKTCSCPAMDDFCPWEGSHQQVVPHLMEDHSPSLHLNHESARMIIVGLDSIQPLTWLTRLHCYQRDFLIQIIKTENIQNAYLLYVVVRNVGTRQDAKRFKRKIEIRGEGRLVVWESIPRSITSDVKKITGLGDCLILHSRIERMLENLTLSITVTIQPGRNWSPAEGTEQDGE